MKFIKDQKQKQTRKQKTKAEAAHKNAVKMAMPNMQRTAATERVPRRWRCVLTRTPECFNNKIKMALLILIWTTIWCRRECVAAARHSNQAVYNNYNNQSNLHEQLEINVVDDNEDVEAIVSSWDEVLDGVVPADVAAERRVEQVLFKRDAAKASEGESAELDATAGYEFTTLDAVMTGVADTQRMKTQQIAEIHTEATTTMYDSNSMATTMNNSVEINEYENVKNNGNENAKRPKVVDRKIIAATTTPTAASLFAAAHTEGATEGAAAGAPQTGDQQNFAENTGEGKGDARETQTNVCESPVDVTAALQQQLIYEFAIKYKHIPRVTYFTCRWLHPAPNHTFGEQMTYLNMQTLAMLQRMYGGGKAAHEMRSEGGAAKAKKASADKVATKRKSVPANAPSATKTITATTARTAALSKAVETNAWTVRSNGNTRGKRSTTAALNNGNVTQSGKGSNRANRRATSEASAANATIPTAAPRDILIKVVHIDQLINKRPTAANNKNSKNNNQRYNWNVQRTFGGGFAAGGGYGRSAAGSAGARNAYTNANWLAQVLRDDGSRQLVALNLACGAASRRLLEMASSKALFNATYHWLLIEDYTFNRNADNDDNADNVHSDNNNNNYNKNCKRTSAQPNNEAVDDDDDNNKSSNNDKNKASQYLTNKFFEQTQTQQLQANKQLDEEEVEQQQKQLTATATSTVATRSTTITSLRPKATLTATPVTANNENTMEIIEKYLEKINININTELILAKRHTRRIRDGAAIDDNKKCTGVGVADGDGAADGAGYDGVLSGRGCGTSDSESATNNTLQRKDYYRLYDVWNPGLQYGGQLNISEIGYFALHDGLQIALWYRRSTTITRRMDMKMARIRCLIVVTNKNHTDTLEHYLTTHHDTHLDSMNRFNFALLSNVRDLFNFSFVMSKTASWGYLKNGKFDGMIGALVRKQADIGGSPIFFRIERAKVIDYTTRTWVARPCFIFRHPPSTKKDRIVFLQPFSNMVWILLGLCGIFTICLLWLLTSVERGLEAVGVVKQLGHSTRSSNMNIGGATTNNRQASAIGGNDELPPVGCRCYTRTTLSAGTMPSCGARNAPSVAAATKEQRKQKPGKLMQRSKTEARKNVQSISCRHCMHGCGSACCGQTGSVVAQQRVGLFFESMLFYVGSICQQGLTFSTSFFSGRCIVITSLLFAFAIYQFYSASIVGTLLMEKPKTIRTLRDLIHSSLAVGVEDIAYNRDYFLRTKDPIAIELYAKKVTSVPTDSETPSETATDNATALATLQPNVELTEAAKAKAYRDILHSHETGAHAKTNEASNWYDPEYGVKRIRRGKFAFHVDVATAYKIIADTFSEKEICELTEIQLFPPQKMVSIVQKGSPLRKVITYGLRRVTESGLMDYQRKVWHSPKPRCVKQIHTDDLRVDLQTFASALLVLIFGCAVSLLALSIEIIQHKLWQRYRALEEDDDDEETVEQN